MNADTLLSESIDGLSLWLHFKVAKADIAEGTATQTQKQFVSSYEQLVQENKARALLKQMRAEAAIIQNQQQIFQKRWACLMGGNLLTHS